MVAVAFVIVFFLPEEPLRTLSGIQARQQDLDAASDAASDAAKDAATAARAAAVTAGSSQPAPGESIHPDAARPDGMRANGVRPDGVRATGSPPRVTSAD